MNRNGYKIFSKGMIGNFVLSNRLVRSATWDPSILKTRTMSDEILNIYKNQAAGGVGLIITGGFPVVNKEMLANADKEGKACSYKDLRIKGTGKMVEVVRKAREDCKIIAQLENGSLDAGPSGVPSPFARKGIRPLSVKEIKIIIRYYAEAAACMKEDGFDGVQLHAAHTGILSCFLSPYKNRRKDMYGGSVANRVRIIKEIVSLARDKVGDFPILVKINCTDYVKGGIDYNNFPELAAMIEKSGVDAIEISGGMWDCLIRPESELGFPPVPAPESHTSIKNSDKQLYFLKYTENLELNIPLILVGGARDIEQLEHVINQGKINFIALCRPLIAEPDLPSRWLEGRGSNTTECISCNSCIYSMIVHPRKTGPGPVTCTFKNDKEEHKMAQKWLKSWVKNKREKRPAAPLS